MSRDLKLHCEIVPIQCLSRTKEAIYLHNVLLNRSPAFKKLVFPTLQCQIKTRKQISSILTSITTHYFKNSFFTRTIESWNDIIISNPISNKIKFQTVQTIRAISLSNFKLLNTYILGVCRGETLNSINIDIIDTFFRQLNDFSFYIYSTLPLA